MSSEPTLIVSPRTLLLVILGGYLALGGFSSVWIAFAQFDDPFCFSDHQLWNALDPGALYYSDTVSFFSATKVETFLHPGLTMTLMGGTLLRVVHGIENGWRWLVGEPTLPLLEAAVFRQREYFAALSFLSCLLFSLSCVPLHAIASRFAPREHADALCGIFLSFTPVILFVNRYSPEPYMLFFGLCSVQLSFRAFEGDLNFLTPFSIGLCTAFSLFAKPLMIPIVIVNLVALVMRQSPAGIVPRSRQESVRALLFWCLGFVPVGFTAIIKLPLRDMFVAQAQASGYGAGWRHVFDVSQRGLAPLIGVVVILGLVSFTLLIRSQRGVRRGEATALAAITAIQIVLISRRPDWHYLFGAAPLLLLSGSFAIFRVIAPISGLRRAGVLIVLLCVFSSLPIYVGAASAFKHYHDRYMERVEAARRDPLGTPAIWEKTYGNSDLSGIWPVYSPALQRTLETMRAD